MYVTRRPHPGIDGATGDLPTCACLWCRVIPRLTRPHSEQRFALTSADKTEDEPNNLLDEEMREDNFSNVLRFVFVFVYIAQPKPQVPVSSADPETPTTLTTTLANSTSASKALRSTGLLRVYVRPSQAFRR